MPKLKRAEIASQIGGINLGKYTFENYQRPTASFSTEVWEEILVFIGEKEVIFDLGCGVGESTFHLAQKYPDKQIVGIDKSLSRIERKNEFKEGFPDNMRIFRGELLDLIPLIYHNQKSLNIVSVFIVGLLLPEVIKFVFPEVS